MGGSEGTMLEAAEGARKWGYQKLTGVWAGPLWGWEWEKIRPSGLRSEWKVKKWIHGASLPCHEGGSEGARESSAAHVCIPRGGWLPWECDSVRRQSHKLTPHPGVSFRCLLHIAQPAAAHASGLC